MGKKKAIECPKELGGCGSTCVQVGKSLDYPKESQTRRPVAVGTKKERLVRGFEWRYTCPACSMEWLQDTSHANMGIEKIDEEAYHIRIQDGREVYYTTEPDIAKRDGVVIGKEYSPEQLRTTRGW